jgi:adenylate cyclase
MPPTGPNETERIKKQLDLFKKKFSSAQSRYENKLRELSVIKGIGQTLRASNPTDQADTFWRLLLHVQEIDSAGELGLAFFDPGEHRFLMAADSTAAGPLTDTAAMSLDRELIQRLRTTLEAQIVDQAGGGKNLYMPLVNNRNCVGVLRVVHADGVDFSSDQIGFYHLVADQMTTASMMFNIYKKMIQEERWRANLSRFFSKSVTHEILKRDQLNLGGERVDLTILFADVHGFTSLAERLPEETVVQLLNSFFTTMTPIVFEHRGTLDKILGDGLLAFFGAPVPLEHSAGHGLRAALDMLDRVEWFNRRHKSQSWPELRLGIGLNHGPVVAGLIGSEDHLSYTVIGDAVNLTQRIESLSRPNEILISQNLYQALNQPVEAIDGVEDFIPLPPMRVKGKREEVRLWRVIRSEDGGS